jgi:uncharacterized protein (DUF885 family)
MTILRRCCVLAAGLFVLTPIALAADSESSWIETSDAHARYVLEKAARFNPEFMGQVGLEGYDEDIIDLRAGVFERSVADLEERLVELRRRLDQASDPRVRQDLEILIQAQDRRRRQIVLTRELTLPYFNVSQTVFTGLRGLLDPQVPEERRAAALIRLRRYAGLEEGYQPLTDLARTLTEERMPVPGLMTPYKVQVEEDLANSPRFMAGIRQLFQAQGVAGYEESMAALESQIQAYNDWVRETVLPAARDDFRGPPALYRLALEQFGVDAEPDELIADALAGYMEIRNQMQALAPLVASDKGWEVEDYPSVIRKLRESQLEPDAVLPYYEQINGELEEIIRRERIVSLPGRPGIIRMATDAETAALPAPHLKTPRLIDNAGEKVEFLIPAASPAAGAHGHGDDTFEAGAWTLAAHELRPGHELQFSAMLETGVPIARALFAFNSVNVEGWALYAEAEVRPYLPLDGQLIGLQAGLWRAARMFLDPMLNTGRISLEEARRVLSEEVVLTPGTVQSELARYTYRAPGQATSYYYGYRRLLQLRGEMELALGERFDRQEFHDFILAQGLLPPDLLRQAVLEEFVPNM